MVARMIGSDCCPVLAITDRFKPNPSKMTAYCKDFLGGEDDASLQGFLFSNAKCQQHSNEDGKIPALR